MNHPRHPTRLSDAASALKATADAIDDDYECDLVGEDRVDPSHVAALVTVQAVLASELAEDNDVLGQPVWKDEIFIAFAHIELARMALLSQQLFEGRHVISLSATVCEALKASAAELMKAEQDIPGEL